MNFVDQGSQKNILKNTVPAPYINIYKIVLMGDGMVGKTSLRKKFSDALFQRNYLMTIGVEVSTKNITININNEKILVTLLIWDLGGQLYFLRIREQYYKGANGAILVYDITNKSSFDNLDRWVNELLDARGSIPLLIVGNKIDLRAKQKDTIETNEGLEKTNQIASKYNLPVDFIETSALTGKNVDAAFQKISKMILKNMEQKTIL